MDQYTFWADVYARTGAVYPRASTVFVILAGAGMAWVLWWGVGQNFRRQEEALTRASETQQELLRLSAEVSKLQSAPVRVEVVQVPVPLQTQPQSVAVDPQIGIAKAGLVKKGDRLYEALIALVPKNEISVQADLQMKAFERSSQGEIETPAKITTPWLFDKDRGIGLTPVIVLTPEREVAIRAREVVIGWRVTAEYPVRAGRMRYEFEGTVGTELNSIDVTKNEARLMKP